MHLYFDCSIRSSVVIRYPLRKKNTVTPKPPGMTFPNPTWLRNTSSTEMARMPSKEGIVSCEPGLGSVESDTRSQGGFATAGARARRGGSKKCASKKDSLHEGIGEECQVGPYASDLTQNRLRRGSLHDVEELIMAIGVYIDQDNLKPNPFIWTVSASDILEKVKRAGRALDNRQFA